DRYDSSNITVVAPDSGRVRVAERWTERLGGTPLAFIHKTRDINVPNSVVANRVVGEVEGRTCIIVDDMIDTAGTITKAADALFDAGAADVLAMATHAVLSDPATAQQGGRVTVGEKESALGRHQASHNSGVVHAGLYYAPGSLKARLCTDGRTRLAEYARERGLPYDECGKVVVAVDDGEVDGLR